MYSLGKTDIRETGDSPFRPPLLTRNYHLQSIMTSLRFRVYPYRRTLAESTEHIIDCGEGVRLLGYLTRQGEGRSRGLFLLIHGWEGSAQSAYILHTGGYLFRRGFDVFRLNLRDHGPSHHLNPGLFHGARTEEVVSAASAINTLSEGRPFFIMGFSLGGNFALRIARGGRPEAFPTLKRVFCVSPVLDPLKTTLAIDEGFPFYRRYFRGKWKRSLKAKQHFFPALYSFDGVFSMKTLMEMTDFFVSRYSPFRDCRDYFSRYTLLGDALKRLSFPATILTSEDDPIIPVNDFIGLRNDDGRLDLSVQAFGGHCGFIDPFPFGCWYEPWVTRQALRIIGGRKD